MTVNMDQPTKPSDLLSLLLGIAAFGVLVGGIYKGSSTLPRKDLAAMLGAFAVAAALTGAAAFRIRRQRNKYSTLYRRLRHDLEKLADQLQMHAKGNCIHMNVPRGPILLTETAHLPEILAYIHERQRRQTAGASNDSYEDFSKPPDF